MSGPPIYYDYLNAATSLTTPSTIHASGTALAAFFRRYLMQLAMSVYKWDLPEHWDGDYMRAVLYTMGYVAVIKTDKYGVIPQQCGLSGYNIFYRPTTALIANPLLPGYKEQQIDQDCVLLRLQSDYRGIADLVVYYAAMMALTAETAGVNILNSKLSYLFTVADKQSAESVKKLYDQISTGSPMAVISKNLFAKDGSPLWQFFSQNVGQNYIADRLMIALTQLENQFKTIIGLPNANTEKRERVNTLEVTSNDVATASRASQWLERLQEGCQKVRDMFGININVDWRFDPPSVNGGEPDESMAEPAGSV